MIVILIYMPISINNLLCCIISYSFKLHLSRLNQSCKKIVQHTFIIISFTLFWTGIHCIFIKHSLDRWKCCFGHHPSMYISIHSFLFPFQQILCLLSCLHVPQPIIIFRWNNGVTSYLYSRLDLFLFNIS